MRLPSGAILTVEADGTYTYDPNGQFDELRLDETAEDSFTYTISDGHGGSDTATVTVTIEGEVVPPVAVDDFVRTASGQSVTISVLENDINEDNLELSPILLSVDEGGSATVNPDGTITFQPDSGYVGTATIVYLLESPDGTASQATVLVDVFRPYVWDSFHDFSEDFETGDTTASQTTDETPFAGGFRGGVRRLSRQIFTLSPDPVYSGYARPGTQIAGKIYDQSGRLVGEAFTSADPAGNWMMQMHGAPGCESCRVEFEYSHQSADIYGYFGLSESDNTYQTLDSQSNIQEALSVQSVMSALSAQTLQEMHREHNDPLGLGN